MSTGAPGVGAGERGVIAKTSTVLAVFNSLVLNSFKNSEMRLPSFAQKGHLWEAL